MHKMTDTDQEKAVAERLRREICGSQPPFSEELHDRLSRAIQQHKANSTPMPIPQSNSNWLSHITWVTSFMGILLVATILWQSLHSNQMIARENIQQGNSRKADLRVLTELANRVTTKADTMIDSAVKAQRWACLDEDAQSVLKTPAARLPLDVVSGLLSMSRQKHSPGPSTHTTINGG